MFNEENKDFGVDLKAIYDKFPFSARQKRLRKIAKITKYLALFLVVFVFLASILTIVLNFSNLKLLANNLVIGKANIEQAVILTKSKDYENARKYTTEAQGNFALAKDLARKYENNFLVENIGFLRGQFADVANLLEAAEVLSRAVSHGLDFVNKLAAASGHKEGSDMNKMTIAEKKSVLRFVYESAPELNGIRADVDLSLINLNKVEYRGFLSIIKDKGENLQAGLEEVSGRLAEAVPMAQILPAIAGYPVKSDFLVILQNNNELRPTGGFIGTYGILETENRDVLRMETHDIYHMDMPVKDSLNITPPEPLQKYLNAKKWYMRDANWSPDWPTAARQIEDFYWKEDALLLEKNKINNFQGKFNGVIAVTPNVIADILNFIGPIKIGNEEYNKDNFQKLLEYRVEKGYVQLGTPEWQRKEVIGQIASELKLRVMNLPASSMVKVFDIFSDNLNKRNIMFYFHDRGLENLATEQDWGGEMRGEQGDYLAIVDANLASFKTDAVINRSISYNLKETDNLIADLRINYAHGGDFDWRTTKYRTYTRIYVSRGSRLISSDGFEGEVVTYEEFNKTVFAGFITVEPKNIGSVRLRYQLPPSLYVAVRNGEYDLYLRKQPGVNSVEMNVSLDFAKKISSYSPTGFYAIKGNKDKSVNWNGEMVVDREFVVKF